MRREEKLLRGYIKHFFQKTLLSSKEMLIFHCHLIRCFFIFNQIIFFLLFIATPRPLSYRVLILNDRLHHILLSSLFRYDHISQVAQVLTAPNASILPTFLVRIRRC